MLNLMCYKLIRTIEELKGVQLDSSTPLFCDTETYTEEGKSDGGLYGAIRLFQLYQFGMKCAIIIDCRFIPLQEVLDYVRSFHHVYHNSSYDLHTINNSTESLWLPDTVDDTIYLSRLLLWKKGSKFGFYDCLQYAGLEDDNIRSIDKKANQKADWGGVLTPTMLKYAAYDVLYLSLLWNEVKVALDTESYKLDIFNLKYAIEYSRRGIPVDRIRVKTKMLEATTDLEDITEKLSPLNFNSPKQCCALLGTKSSDHDTLVRMKLEGHPEAGLISDARSLVKKVGFLKKYDRDIVKGYYNPSSAISGRWSCTGGDVFDHSNLQQIPRELLECLMATAGKTFVYKDYAGLELRMAVAWIAEPTMERLILEGVDLHTYTASKLFNVRMEDVTYQQRLVGKICNFLLIYGGGIAVLQANLRGAGILYDFKETKAVRTAWMEEYQYFNEWHRMTRRHMEVYGYLDVETALGRQVRCYSTNDALNTPVQGSSAEVTKMSLKFLKERYEDEYLVSTIHDSATLMVGETSGELWGKRLDEAMLKGWDFVVSRTALPDLPMDSGSDINNTWSF